MLLRSLTVAYDRPAKDSPCAMVKQRGISHTRKSSLPPFKVKRDCNYEFRFRVLYTGAWHLRLACDDVALNYSLETRGYWRRISNIKRRSRLIEDSFYENHCVVYDKLEVLTSASHLQLQNPAPLDSVGIPCRECPCRVCDI